jgi:hypothetical protein
MKREKLRMLSYLPIAVAPLLIVMSVAHVGANGNNLTGPNNPCPVQAFFCNIGCRGGCCNCIQNNRVCNNWVGCLCAANRTGCRAYAMHESVRVYAVWRQMRPEQRSAKTDRPSV